MNSADNTAIVSMRHKAVQAIHSPLGFFVLALLIVEAFLLGAGIWFNLPELYKIIAIGVGIILFIGVFATVVWLVVRYPQNLVFSEESHIQIAKMKMFGSEKNIFTGQELENLLPELSPNPPSEQLGLGKGDAKNAVI